MREKLITFYNPDTQNPYFVLYVKEIEENLIDGIHLFSRSFDETLILDVLNDFEGFVIHINLLIQKCLKSLENRLSLDVKVLTHNFYRKSENITYDLDKVLEDLQFIDKGFVRIKVR